MDLPYTLEPAHPPQIGLVVLQSDETIEADMRRLIPSDVELLVSRVRSGTEVSRESLARMEDVLTDAARLFPASADFRVVGYGCTSGTAQIGVDRIADLIRAGIPTAHVTQPVSALVAACHEIGARRIGMVSPYVASVSDRLRDVLATEGIEITAFASFNEAEEARVVRIDRASVFAAGAALAKSGDFDTLFLSCTNLRTLEVINPLEAELGIPVLSSNLVLAWHMLKLAKVDAAANARGRHWTRV